MNSIYKFQEYLQELECAQMGKQTDRRTNQMHKHFSTLLGGLKNH